jgi:hypothetical protein
MIRLSKSVLAVRGVILAGGLITVMNPKTVHAVAAALVQVTNTASNPVVTQSAVQQAGQIIHLHCSESTTGPYGGRGCGLVVAPGATSQVYVVPANQSFVVTSVDIFPTQIYMSATCSVFHSDGLYVSGADISAYYAQTWLVDNLSVHYSYPSGIVIAPGSSITGSSSYFGNPSASCYSQTDYEDQFDLYGYLTAS